MVVPLQNASIVEWTGGDHGDHGCSREGIKRREGRLGSKRNDLPPFRCKLMGYSLSFNTSKFEGLQVISPARLSNKGLGDVDMRFRLLIS